MIDSQAIALRIQDKKIQASWIKASQLVNCQTHHQSFDGLANDQEDCRINDIGFTGASNRGESNLIVSIQDYIDFQNEDKYIQYLGKSIKILGLDLNKLDIRFRLSLDSVKSIQQEKANKIYICNKTAFFTQTYYPISLIRKIKTCSIIDCDYNSDGKMFHHLTFLDKDGLIFMRICYIDWQIDKKRTQNFLSEKLKSNFTVILNANLTKNNIDLTFYNILQSININRIQANRASQKKYKKAQNQIRNRIILFSQKAGPALVLEKNMPQKLHNFCIKDIATKNIHLKVRQNSKILVLSEFQIADALVQTFNERMNKYTQIFNILKQQIFNPIQFNFEQMLNRNAFFTQLFTLYFNCTLKIKNQTQINQEMFKDRLNNQIMNIFLDARQIFFQKKQKNRNLENSHFYGQLDNCKLCLVCLVKYNKANKPQAQALDNSKVFSSKQEYLPEKDNSNYVKYQYIEQENSIEEDEKGVFKTSKKSRKSLKIKQKLKNKVKNEDQKIDRSNNIRKRKTKYKCIGCSITFEKDIPLCILCFKQFHNDISKYLPAIKKRYTKKHKQPSKLMSLMCSGSLINHGRQKQEDKNNNSSRNQQVQIKIQYDQNHKIQKTNIEIRDEWRHSTFENQQMQNQILRSTNMTQQILQENKVYDQIDYGMSNMHQMLMLTELLQSQNQFLQKSQRMLLQSMFGQFKPQCYEDIQQDQLKKQQE